MEVGEMDDIRVRVTHGNTVTIAEIDFGIGIMVIGEARLHPKDKGYDPVIGASYAVGRAMTTAGKYLTDVAAELVDGNGCQCPPCQIVKHWSDCALHGKDIGTYGAGEISYKGPCNCGRDRGVEPDACRHWSDCAHSVDSDGREVSTGQIPHDEVQPPPPPDVGWHDVEPGWFSMLLKKLKS